MPLWLPYCILQDSTYLFSFLVFSVSLPFLSPNFLTVPRRTNNNTKNHETVGKIPDDNKAKKQLHGNEYIKRCVTILTTFYPPISAVQLQQNPIRSPSFPI